MSVASTQIQMTVMDHHDPDLLAEAMAAVERVAATGAFTMGAAVESFERDWAAFCDVPHAVGVSSGTDALVLALRAMGIGAGADVVVPANSFIATAEAVSLAGARPVFADVDPLTQLVTAASVKAALTPATCCVIPVHLFGRTVAMDAIMALAREAGLRVLEDASQAHGARYRGRHVGTIGDAGTFSFYPAKNLGAWGDAGAIVTRDAELAERARLLRSHGESPRYHHRMVGTTARLDALQAAVLTVKLARLREQTERRRAVAAALRAQLHGAHPVVLPAALDRDCDHVYHQFVVRTPCRETIRERLAAQGVATAVHYPIPIHRSEAYAAAQTGTDPAPCATRLAGEILSLPIFPSMSDHEVARVAEAVHTCASELREPLVPSAA